MMGQNLMKCPCNNCVLFVSMITYCINDIVFLHILICSAVFILYMLIVVAFLILGIFSSVIYFHPKYRVLVTSLRYVMFIVYYMSIPSLSGLWLICSHLVLILPFLLYWLLFMIIDLGVSPPLLQSYLLSEILSWCHSFGPAGFGVLSSHLTLCHNCTCVPAAYKLSITIMVNWAFLCKYGLLVPSPFLICSWRYCSAIVSFVNMSCVVHDQSTLLCYPDDVWLSTVICVVGLCNYPMNPLSTIFPLHGYCRPYRKESESLQVSLPFRYLSWQAFRVP